MGFIFRVPGGGQYWIATVGSAGSDFGYSAAPSPDGGVYVTGSTVNGSADDTFVVKYSSAGVLVWQRGLGTSPNVESARGIATDSVGNLYITGQLLRSGALQDTLVAKYDSTGSLLWQRALGGTGNDYGNAIAVDASNNVYVTGYTYSLGNLSANIFLAKYDSAGSLAWQRSLSSTVSDLTWAIDTDSSGNVYLVGNTDSGGAGSFDLYVVKYNSSGTLLWQRAIGNSSDGRGFGISVDTANNIYVCGYITTAGNYDTILVKYDATGNVLWQRALSATGYDEGASLLTDTSNNVYLIGRAGEATSSVLVVKYDATGTLLWQRTLGGTGADVGLGVCADASGNLFIVGATTTAGQGGNDALVVKLPADGSKTGTYGAFTYQSSSLTPYTPTLTQNTPALVSAASALTGTVPTLTSYTTTLTSTTIPI